MARIKYDKEAARSSLTKLLDSRYETGNQIQASEQGAIKNAGTDAEALSVQGSYSYIDLDGNQITVNYVADGKYSSDE